MNDVVHETVLASSVNDGGVFLVGGGAIERLSRIDTTGMTSIPGGFLWARQAEGRAELRRLGERTVQRICLVEQSLDLHDVLWHNGHVYVVGTALNTIYEFDENFTAIRHWALPGESDSQHVNSLCMHEGRLLASRFGRFEHHRGYKGHTRGAGEVFDVVSGEILISGLSQPHTLKSFGGRLWVCDSEAHTLRTYRDFVAEDEYRFDGYVRGLAFGASDLYVGLSRSRNDPDGTLPSACIVVLDRARMTPVARIELPTDEIYDLCVVADADTENLRAAALADANLEFDTLAHARNLAAEAAYRAEVDAAKLGHKVLALQGRESALEGHIAYVSGLLGAAQNDILDMSLRAQEETIWMERLETDNARLRLLIESHETHIDRQADALQTLRGFADAVAASYWWRSTRPLRRIDPVLPPPFDAPFEPADPALGAERAEVPIFGLEFDVQEMPTVSIVVTAYGRFEETLACLKAIRRADTSASYEVIVIEDCSGEREMARFRSIPGLRYYANAENLGFLKSANQALDLARGEYVHFLNNDALVRPGWLDALLRTFAIFHECGIAGSKLVYPDGRLQEAGGIVWSDGNACNFGRGDAPDKPMYELAHETDYVSGASLMIPAKLLRALGGFDERYSPAYYEDTDLAYRIREAGRKVYVQPASVVVHQEGLSHGTDPEVGIKASQTRNRDVFLSRWRETLEREQLRPGEHLFLAKDRAQLKKCILIVDRHPPHSDRDAGSRAIWQLMRVLHVFGFSIKFWSQETENDPAYRDLLQMHGIELFTATETDGGFDAWIAENGCYLDYVLLSRPLVADRHIDAVRRHSTALVMYYGHDVHYLRIDRQHALTQEFGLDAHARHLQSVEQGVWRKSDLILYPSDEETRHVQQWLDAVEGDARAMTIPLFAYENVPALPDSPEHLPQARRNVLFVGGFAHAPNEDGAVWFAHEVWPLVRARHPDYRLCLVGSNPTEAVLALAADDVIVTGFLSESDLIEHYNNARVAIAPLRFGAGTKGKVLEAMRFGVPCVTTTTGVQGLADAGFLRVADDAAAMASHIFELIENDAFWLQASGAAQAFIRERFSVHTVWHALSQVMNPQPYGDVAERRQKIAQVAAPGAFPPARRGNPAPRTPEP